VSRRVPRPWRGRFERPPRLSEDQDFCVDDGDEVRPNSTSSAENPSWAITCPSAVATQKIANPEGCWPSSQRAVKGLQAD
jgi:hypothetical protein